MRVHKVVHQFFVLQHAVGAKKVKRPALRPLPEATGDAAQNKYVAVGLRPPRWGFGRRAVPHLPALSPQFLRPHVHVGRRAQILRTPSQMNLARPEVLQAFDRQFMTSAHRYFEGTAQQLKPKFFVHMKVVDSNRAAKKLARALWGTTGPEAGFFRAYAYAQSTALERQISEAADKARVVLPPGKARWAADLLQLNGLEACRAEFYNDVLSGHQRWAQHISAIFQPEDRRWAEQRIALNCASLGFDAANIQLLSARAGKGLPVQAHLLPAEILLNPRGHFEVCLENFMTSRWEALALPTQREEGAFYPALPPYRPS